jgi:site-specific recombinase XerD
VDWYDELLADYFAWLLRRGRSPNTVAVWRSSLRSFGRWIAAERVADPGQLGRRHIEEWQDHERARVGSPRTAIGAATALRGLLRYAELEREELGIQPGLVWRVAMPKSPEYLPRPLEREEVVACLRYFARPTNDLVFLRDRALFMTLLTSGARISEALQMRVESLGGRLPIVVLQKGNREKRLVLSETAHAWIEQYMRARGTDDQDALWIRQVGPGAGAGRLPLSQEAVNERWASLARHLGIRRFTSHQLRHTAGTELLEQGARDVEVASVLGHANLNMVARYAKVREKRRQELVNGLDALMPAPPAGSTGQIVRFRRPRRPGGRRR